tara:strand:- start:141 stop:323 length:183 start_codon:yes stop_codon:yes gene_type:complete
METFTMEEIQLKLKIQEAIDAVHHHELYWHNIAQDILPLALGIVNTLALMYIIYKLNTNK